MKTLKTIRTDEDYKPKEQLAEAPEDNTPFDETDDVGNVLIALNHLASIADDLYTVIGEGNANVSPDEVDSILSAYEVLTEIHDKYDDMFPMPSQEYDMDALDVDADVSEEVRLQLEELALNEGNIEVDIDTSFDSQKEKEKWIAGVKAKGMTARFSGSSTLVSGPKAAVKALLTKHYGSKKEAEDVHPELKEEVVTEELNINKVLAYAKKIGGDVKGNTIDFGQGSVIKVSVAGDKIKFDGGKSSGIETFKSSAEAIAALGQGVDEDAELHEASPPMSQWDDKRLLLWLKTNWTSEKVGPVFGAQLKTAAAEAKKRGLSVKLEEVELAETPGGPSALQKLKATRKGFQDKLDSGKYPKSNESFKQMIDKLDAKIKTYMPVQKEEVELDEATDMSVALKDSDYSKLAYNPAKKMITATSALIGDIHYMLVQPNEWKALIASKVPLDYFYKKIKGVYKSITDDQKEHAFSGRESTELDEANNPAHGYAVRYTVFSKGGNGPEVGKEITFPTADKMQRWLDTAADKVPHFHEVQATSYPRKNEDLEEGNMTDMVGKTCPSCKKGKFKDNAPDGYVRCDSCEGKVKRWKSETSLKKEDLEEAAKSFKFNPAKHEVQVSSKRDSSDKKFSVTVVDKETNAKVLHRMRHELPGSREGNEREAENERILNAKRALKEDTQLDEVKVTITKWNLDKAIMGPFRMEVIGQDGSAAARILDKVLPSSKYDLFDDQFGFKTTAERDAASAALVKFYKTIKEWDATEIPLGTISEEFDASKFRRLAITGLVPDTDVALIIQAMKALDAGKTLTVQQKNLIATTFQSLIGLVTGDTSVFAKIQGAVKKNPADAK